MPTGRWKLEREDGKKEYIASLDVPWVIKQIASRIPAPPMSHSIEEGVLVGQCRCMGLVFSFVYEHGLTEEKAFRGVTATTVFSWQGAGALRAEGVASRLSMWGRWRDRDAVDSSACEQASSTWDRSSPRAPPRASRPRGYQASKTRESRDTEYEDTSRHRLVRGAGSRACLDELTQCAYCY